jgi:hypothetical protein
MSLIEKIDAEIAKLGNRIEQYENGNKIAYGISVGLEKAKEIILSQQKESATDINVTTKTIGDKIRESNESLAEFIKTVTDKCIIGNCRTCSIYKACDQKENKEDLVKYFSQPYTDSKIN